MLLFTLPTLAAAPQAPTTNAPKGPEPVYDLADKDLKRLREARVAQFASFTLPAVFLAGAFAQAQLLPDPDTGRVKADAQSVTAATLYGVGALGMIVSSTMLQHLAVRSRNHLQAQGLRVRRTPAVVVPTLAVLGVASAYGSTFIRAPSDQVETSGLVFGLGLYAASVGVGSFQLDLNRRARKNAGWIGVAPRVDGATQGLALVGEW